VGDRDRCPCCGTTVEVSALPLVAACDVLILRALERVGNRILREDRSRFGRFGDRPRYEAHTAWQADRVMIDKYLDGAWDAVPMVLAEHGCCGATPEQVTAILDRYVRDLVVTMTGHSTVELRYRLSAYLGVPA
jgi:hypothetical protein